MPKRYRPPERRRKSKKAGSSQETAAPTYGDAAAPAPTMRAWPAPSAATQERSSSTKHIARDHRYIQGELRLIGLLTAFITGGLLITAVLR